MTAVTIVGTGSTSIISQSPLGSHAISKYIEKELRACFIYEAAALTRMSFSPHVPRIFSIDVTPKHYIIHMTRYTMDLQQLCYYYPKLLTPDTVRYIMYSVFLALRDCHGVGLLHQDVKPSNIFVNIEDKKVTSVALGDWGWAQTFNIVHGSDEKIQTPHYRAPEVALGMCGYTSAIDIWSAGATLYNMDQKQLLFKSTNALGDVMTLFELYGTPDYAKACFPQFKPKLLHMSSPELTDLIGHLLDPDPKTRFTATQALNHKYFDPLRPHVFDEPCSLGSDTISFDPYLKLIPGLYSDTVMCAATIYFRTIIERQPDYINIHNMKFVATILLRLAQFIYEPKVLRESNDAYGYEIQDQCLKILNYNLFIDSVILSMPPASSHQNPVHTLHGHFNFCFGVYNVWKDDQHEYSIIPFNGTLFARYESKGWTLVLTPASVSDYSIVRRPLTQDV